MQLHSNLDLGAVNLGVYLDLVANSLLTEILLQRNSEFRRFWPIWRPRFRRRFPAKLMKLYGNFEQMGLQFHEILIKLGLF